ncbi:uncharacterized protein ARMOST_22028 [Armillaria ostoyae]|uniref:HAT C-terminal dimerisation domain-containing protein n=1 Tax=Armillaria ostoyae TaxID=47428 RepID=A0A284SBT5_ARMOS|nr:uncharacterized protein ARMOST_22028 [Armillaria ostoyae]
MISILADNIPAFPGEKHRTRCFAHVINLIAKSLLNQFQPPKKKKEDATNDIERDLIELAEGLEREDLDVRLEEAEAAAGHVEKDDVDGLIDEVVLLSAEDKEKWLAETRSVQMALIRKLSYKIIHSSTILLPEWRKIIDELKLAQKMLLRDVSTRWNSTFDMLDAAIAYKSAIKEITGDENNKLTEYELSRTEWTVLENLCDVLKVLKDATLYFSRSTPNLATVIPAMDHIDQVFATASIQNTQLSAPMRASLLVAKKTLNRYYSMTDKSDLYRIAMILHPRYKLDYFVEANWEPGWIADACRVLCEEFDRKYKHLMDDVVVMEDEKDTNAQSLQSDNIFDNLNSLKAPKRADVRDDLDRYLSTDTELTDNPLMWWKEKQSMYPCLSRMALDYLSIPATSVDVERTFSRGHLLISHIRNKLTAQTSRALMCLGQWSVYGFIHDTDIQDVSRMPELPEDACHEDQDFLMPEGWDRIE